MINLVSLNVKELTPRHMPARIYAQHCGMLTSPRNRKNPHGAIDLGAKWAADNDCFIEFNPRRIIEWLQQNQAIAPTCLWFNTPDVVRNASATLFNFWIWQPIINAFGFKVAFTLQNGMEQNQIPWDYCAAVFIGGDNAFKYSEYVRGIAAETIQRGLWLHMGRVNSVQRIIYSKSIGCHSFDGTNYTRYPFEVADHLRLHRTTDYQLMLGLS